ncbi:MAG TPA: signal peptide peptidase SppA [Candidatus Binataceae bacterium]|nr:signal peptide peptidase SppA [Candidatus Binataceae bacterium]
MEPTKKATAESMKITVPDRLWISREARLAIVVALLCAAGAVECASENWSTGIELIGIAGALSAAFWFFVLRPAHIPHDAVLAFKLTGPIQEAPRRSPLEQLLRRGPLSLDQVRYALDAAATDPQIRAVVVQIAGLETGIATAHEIYRGLRAVQTAGKRVIALLRGDTAALGEYLAAAGAGEIVINPDTTLALHGIATRGVFLKSVLDKLKVQAQTLQWKEYKGAGETLSRDTMSPVLRESIAAVVGDWEKIIIEAISSARKIDPARIRELLASGFVTAKFGVDHGLVDREGYIEDIHADLDSEGKGHPFVSIGRYCRHAALPRAPGRPAKIALIHACGPIIGGNAPAAGEFVSGPATALQFERASRDERIKAIVFRVNSPGGSAVGSDLVWRAVREAQHRGKPVVVSMGDVAGSGGYYVAAGADAIVAEAATVTGSIGVVYAKFNFARVLDELGVRIEYVKTAENSDSMSITRPLTEAELTQVNDTLGHLYGNFTAKVAQGRHLLPERTEELARGRIWSGIAARENGLVDEIGGMDAAIRLARRRANIPDDRRHELVTYHHERRLLGLPLGIMPAGPTWPMRTLAELLGIPARWAPAMAELAVRGGIMLLCPWFDL